MERTNAVTTPATTQATTPTTPTTPTASRTRRVSRGVGLTGLVLSAVLTAGVMCVASSGTAVAAPTASAYLGWETGPHPGPCPAQDRQEVGDFSFDPAEHSQRIYAGTSNSGYFQTRKWVENGVSRARQFDVCRDGALFHSYSPLEYQHRNYEQEWNCANLSCRFMFDHTSDWVPGTEFPPNPCPGQNC